MTAQPVSPINNDGKEKKLPPSEVGEGQEEMTRIFDDTAGNPGLTLLVMINIDIFTEGETYN
jgi:hypothetical protein